MTKQECRGIFLSHASEDKEQIVKPLIECLKKAGINDIWYDEYELEEGHSIIRKINQGLSNLRIGLVIITPNFIRKDFSNWELDCLMHLTIYNKIRLIPLMRNISREQIVTKYPLMNPLHFKEINDECDEDLIMHVKNYLGTGISLFNNPNAEVRLENFQIGGEEVFRRDTKGSKSRSLQEIDQETLIQVYNRIQSDLPIKEVNVTKIRTLSSKRRIWVHKESWNIIKYLIFSDTMEDIRDGLFILGEMVKLAKLETKLYVLRNVKELFVFRLLDLSDPLNIKRLSQDALNVLEYILDSRSFFMVCIAALTRVIEELHPDEKYNSSIQFFFPKFQTHKSKENISALIGRLEKLVEESGQISTKNRAKDFVEVIIQDYHYLL